MTETPYGERVNMISQGCTILCYKTSLGFDVIRQTESIFIYNNGSGIFDPFFGATEMQALDDNRTLALTTMATRFSSSAPWIIRLLVKHYPIIDLTSAVGTVMVMSEQQGQWIVDQALKKSQLSSLELSH